MPSMILELMQAIVDLINNCTYHPVLETIGLGLDSDLFDLIITTRCQ